MKHIILIVSLFLVACGSSNNKDPYEKTNRAISRFNDKVDKYTLKPVSKAYAKNVPKGVQQSITNFFDNIAETRNFINNVLQGKLKDASVDVGRFTINSTIGVLGFFDVATDMGLARNDEDFGQTLGKWGVKSGPYIVLPFFGPSSMRDAFSKVPDMYSNATDFMPDKIVSENRYYWGAKSVGVVNTRASLLGLEDLIQGDRYTFLRNAYLENREFRVKDGQVEDDF